MSFAYVVGLEKDKSIGSLTQESAITFFPKGKRLLHANLEGSGGPLATYTLEHHTAIYCESEFDKPCTHTWIN